MDVYSRVEKGFTEYDNWRYLRSERIIYARDFANIQVSSRVDSQIDRDKIVERRLLVLLGNYYLVSFPNMHILEYVNSDSERKGIVLAAEGRQPEYCKRCYGAGKFDWVSDITGPSRVQSRFEFVRDKRLVLLYHKCNGKLSKNNIWAPTEVCEGERICDDCLGTGIDFNADYQFLPNLKSRLVLYDIRHLLTR